jgi:4-aminobutyrate aminotransferase/(S)-3-amino-2-methylpropionate transaminase
MKGKYEKSAKLLKDREENVPRGVDYATPLFIDQGKGAIIKDIDGNEYIDFAGGIGVENVGHCSEEVVTAVKRQAEKCLHSCFMLMGYESYVSLAKRLNAIAPGRSAKKTFFVNSGAEAVENAVKIAKYYTKRRGVVCFENAFHGRTYLASALSGRVRPYKYHFDSFVPGIFAARYAYCYRCPWGMEYPACNVQCGDKYFTEDFFRRHIDGDEIGAVIIEVVQGEGGFIAPPIEYIKKVRRVCDDNGILLVVDEIQTGYGRSGKMFATEHFSIEPDLLVVGKSIAGGLPLAGVIGKAEVMDSVHPGGLGGTFSGNPLACEAGLAVLGTIEKENLIDRSKTIGERIYVTFEEFKEKYRIVGDFRGVGSMMALELVRDRTSKEPASDEAKKLRKYCYENGLIILVCGVFANVIRTLMPFVITDEQLERGMEILEAGLKTISK